jgi:kynurenine formamidase
VKIVGADAWSWDAPFSHTAKRWDPRSEDDLGRTQGWPRDPYWQMEKLTNLASLPPFGYDILCFLVKIRGASAGWSRVVAMFQV